MRHGSEFNIRFRSHLGSYNLYYHGEGLARFQADHCEIEGDRLRDRPGLLRGCYGSCLSIIFDCACCGIGNWVLIALSAFTLKPLVWLFGSETRKTPIFPAGDRPIRAKGRVIRFMAHTPEVYMKLRFCFIADTEAQAQVIAGKLDQLRPAEEQTAP